MEQSDTRGPRKVLFLAVPLKGHLVHTARLSEWFLQYPEDYEVHVGGAASVFPLLPEGVIAHVNEAMDSEMEERLVGGMQASAEGRDQLDSFARMLDGVDMSLLAVPLTFALRTVERVRPDVAICDHSYAFGNYLHTFCRHLGLPLVVITSMGRPETILKPLNMLRALFRHFGTMRRAMGKMSKGFADVEALVGKPLPSRDAPITIFPSAQVLVEDAPARHEFFTGPFLPLPSLVEETHKRILRRSSSFSLPLAEHPELKEWLSMAARSGQPIVYIALGTLVKPSAELIGRLVEGLDQGPWKILWALPESQQHLLPRRLPEGQWYVDTFLPQFALFRTGLVRAFVSHCGSSSTHEALCQGVPMVCMPFFGDQYEWADSVCNFVKAGVRIDKFASTPAMIHDALDEVLQSPEYKDRAVAAAQRMVERARIRLKWLQHHWSEHRVALEKDMKVGVPVAAALIDACLHGQNPRDVMPQPPSPPPAWSCPHRSIGRTGR